MTLRRTHDRRERPHGDSTTSRRLCKRVIHRPGTSAWRWQGNPKSETRNPKQARNGNDKCSKRRQPVRAVPVRRDRGRCRCSKPMARCPDPRFSLLNAPHRIQSLQKPRDPDVRRDGERGYPGRRRRRDLPAGRQERNVGPKQCARSNHRSLHTFRIDRRTHDILNSSPFCSGTWHRYYDCRLFLRYPC